MGTQRKCDKCPSLYGADEAPGILCPICQVGQDSFERGIKALAVGLGLIGGVIALVVGLLAAGSALVRWSGFPFLAQCGLLAAAAVVGLFVAWVIGESVLDEIAKRKTIREGGRVIRLQGPNDPN